MVVTAHGESRVVTALELARVFLQNAGLPPDYPSDAWIQHKLERQLTLDEIVTAALAGLR